MNVPESSLGEPLSRCPVCGAAEIGKPITRLQHEPKVDLVRCNRCLAGFAERMPNDAYLADLYDPAKYHSAMTSNAALTARCSAAIVAKFPMGNRQQIRVLDYGGGNGDLAQRILLDLRAQSPTVECRATVVDIHPREDDGDVSFISVDQFFQTDERYDLVIASAVLEHVPQVADVIQRLFRVGGPQSLFYARAPFEAPLAKLAPGFRLRWPRHVHDFSPEFWEHLGDWIEVETSMIASRTSLVESTLQTRLFHTVAAHVLKAPSRIETALIKPVLGYSGAFWRLVGGWEVFMLINPNDKIVTDEESETSATSGGV